MSWRTFALFLREHWEFITCSSLAGVIAAMGLILVTPAKFAATAELFLATPGYASMGSLATTEASPYLADAFSQERARTYVQLATRDDLARRVVERLRLSMTPEDLSAATSASAQPDTVLIDVTVESESPSEAMVLANAVASELATDIRTLELPGGVLIPNVDPILTQAAQEPKKPSSPNIIIYLLVGLTLGFLAGTTGAAWWGSARAARGIRVIKRITGRPLLAVGDSDLDMSSALQTDAASITGSNSRVVALASVATETALPETVTAKLASDLGGARARAVLVTIGASAATQAIACPSQDKGLAAVLVGDLPLAYAIRHGSAGTLDLLDGVGPDNWLPLLRSQRFHQLIVELRSSYDLVLLHHPDFLNPAVATAFNDSIDGVVLIANEGQVKRGELAGATRRLNIWNIELIGTVVLSPRSSDQAKCLRAEATSGMGV